MATAQSAAIARRVDKRLLSRGKAQGRAQGIFQAISMGLRHWGYSTDLYNWRLRGRHPLKVDRVLPDCRRGNAATARRFCDAFKANGNVLQAATAYWDGAIDGFDPDHSFDLLLDLKALPDAGTARANATALLTVWCDQYLTWDAKAWAPDITAWRLINWLSSVELILGSTDLIYRSRVLLAVARQMRHLPRVVGDIHDPMDKAAAGAALSLAGLCLPDAFLQKEKGFRLLAGIVGEAVLPDGSPRSRRFGEAVTLFTLLTLVRSAAKKADVVLPDSLQQAMDKIAPYLRACRFAGGTATSLFGGDRSLDPQLLDTLLDEAETPGSAGFSFPYGGLQRLAASGSVLLVDTGPSIRGSLSRASAASSGAFEFSAGSEALIVSMGVSANPDLAPLCRTSAAFSNAVIDNRNSTEIMPSGQMGAGVSLTETIRRAHKDGEEVTLIHDGYAKRLRLKQSRAIKLSRDGLVLTGVEQIELIKNALPTVPMNIWFHLHPDVSATLGVLKDHIVLTTKTNKKWMLAATGGALSIEDSLFNASPDTPQATKAVLLHADEITLEKTGISWSLTRRE